MLGKLALKLQRLADAEMQYERYKAGADVLANDLMSIRDGLEREVVKIIYDLERALRQEQRDDVDTALSYIYSNNSSKETVDERK